MIVATWNVNSIRAREERLRAWLDRRAPDVLCLQETKVEDEGFPTAMLEALGYRSVVHGTRTYNGVAILARAPIDDVQRGLDDGVDDPQARFIAATIEGIRICSVYVPNGQAPEAPAFQYKRAWLARLRGWLERHARPDQPLIVCGDFNVAPEPRDVWSPELWEGHIHFTVEERAWLEETRSWGLVDVLRRHHPEPGIHSWWDYRQLSFPKGHGLRIDLVYATEPLAARSTDCFVDRAERKGKAPSDHAPVVATFAAS